MNSLDNRTIYEGIYNATILIGSKPRILDNDELKWHEVEDVPGERYLTLKEIYQQIKEKGYEGTIYVWEEQPLTGIIYQCGNYEECEWVEHGTTRGYA